MAPHDLGLGAVNVGGVSGFIDGDRRDPGPAREAGPRDPSSLVSELLEYMGALVVTQGDRAGGPFEVLPWQREFVELAFGREASSDCALSVARGAGKSTFVAALAAAAIAGPLQAPRAEVLIVASSFQQARVTWDHLLAFLRRRYRLETRSTWRLWDTTQVAKLLHVPSGASVRTIASDPKRMHGLAPSLVLADEPAQWERTKAEAAVAALRTGLGKIPGGRLIALGTRADAPGHWFERMLVEGPSLVFASAKDADPLDEQVWHEANPSLAHFPALLQRTRDEAQAASKDPGSLAAFRALRLNAGVPDVVEALLIDADVWRDALADAPARGGYVLGVDPGYTGAMSALAAYWPDTGRLDALGCFGKVPDVLERGRRDGVGKLYAECVADGDLVLHGDRVSDLAALLREGLERWGRPVVVVSDRYREGELRDALERARFPLASLQLRGQGYKDGGEDVRSFREATLTGRVAPVASRLLTSAMGAARTVSDPAGNAKLAKGSQGGRLSASRDDAAAAAVLAVALGHRQRKTLEPKTRSRRVLVRSG